MPEFEDLKPNTRFDSKCEKCGKWNCEHLTQPAQEEMLVDPDIDCFTSEEGDNFVVTVKNNKGQEKVKVIPLPRDGKDGEHGVDGQDGQDGAKGDDGEDGNDGKDGQDGESARIDCSQTDDGDVVLKIQNPNEEEKTKIIPAGKDGQDGADGQNGQNAESPTIECVDTECGFDITITNPADDCPIIKSVKNGVDGKDGQDGQDGSNGQDGQDGADGFTPTIGCTETDAAISFSITNKDKTVVKSITKPKDGINGQDGANGLNGADGQNGLNGADGFSPSVTCTETETAISFSITNKDGSQIKSIPKPKDGVNGADGQDGQDGQNGSDGANGIDGQSATIGCVQTAPDTISFSITNPDSPTITKTIVAPKGDTGAQGPAGVNGVNGTDGQNGTVVTCDSTVPGQTTFLLDGVPSCIIPHSSNGGSSTISCIETATAASFLIDGVVACTIPKGVNGADGQNGINGTDGQDGADGISPTVDCAQNANGSVTLSITDVNGTSIKTIPAGQDGANGQNGTDGQDGTNGTNGQDGQDGFSPTIDCDRTGNNVQFTITDINGVTTKNIDLTPVGQELCCNEGFEPTEFNPDTCVITGTLNQSNGDPVEIQIPLSDYFSVEEVDDPDGCSKYNSFKIGNKELFKFPIYEPTQSCACFCVTYLEETQETITFDTASGFDWSWESNDQSVTGSDTSNTAGDLTQTFAAGTYLFTACQKNACERAPLPTFSSGRPTCKNDCGC